MWFGWLCTAITIVLLVYVVCMPAYYLYKEVKERRLTFNIDLDKDPLMPPKMSLLNHRRQGQWRFSANQLDFVPVKNLTNVKIFTLDCGAVLNANALDHLLANRHLLEDEFWEKLRPLLPMSEKKRVLFTGTIYVGPGQKRFVRGLTSKDEKMRWVFVEGDRSTGPFHGADRWVREWDGRIWYWVWICIDNYSPNENDYVAVMKPT
jgi:hypothetical protein